MIVWKKQSRLVKMKRIVQQFMTYFVMVKDIFVLVMYSHCLTKPIEMGMIVFIANQAIHKLLFMTLLIEENKTNFYFDLFIT